MKRKYLFSFPYYAAARALCIINILRKDKKSDILRKRRPARELYELQLISRDAEFIAKYRLSEDLLNILIEDISTHLPNHRRISGLTNKLKVRSCSAVFNKNIMN